ncbi:MAG: OmpA family protein [Mastigocoleus sp. MO_167.B18]|nr:OmpA family protein [Mastigocoleus sp. MO_167.B18]
MSDYSMNELGKKSPNNHHDLDSNELNELRLLLLGIEQSKLNNLYKRLENPEIQPEDVSKLLPEAVVLRSKQDRQLGEAMIRTVEDAIQGSVKQDINTLSEVIFPIVAPATRKAIATALDEMIQSLNQTLEHSLSPESFKWRWEAKRTGKSFAEIVLLRTLIFRVEQVFLIHKKTGLLLQHVVAPQVATQDPELVSAMLTAIEDFVEDSFNVARGNGLQSLKLGDLNIWVEEGPLGFLAVVMRGNAPQELRSVFQEAVEKIHLKFADELNDFDGETDTFITSKPYLEACLRCHYKSENKNKYTYAWIFLGIIAAILGTFSFFAIRDLVRRNSLIAELNEQPGIVVMKSEQQGGKFVVSGMRDPLAVEPQTLLQKVNFSPKEVTFQLKAYQSLEAELMTRRARKILEPPDTTSLQVNENGLLQAKGSAPHEWILKLRQVWHFIPGVNELDDINLISSELNQLNLSKLNIEQTKILFEEGTTNLLPNQGKKLEKLKLNSQKLFTTAQNLNRTARVRIIGHANTKGDEKTNITLSQNRAEKILRYLDNKEIKISHIRAIGVGSTQPLKNRSIKTNTKEDMEKANIRVSFKVFITENKE